MDLKGLFSLNGKTALVTGAARGLGREISVGLAQYGASLVLADVTYPQETAQLVKQCGTRCLAVETDISDERQVQDLTKMARAEYRQVDILVNNAVVPN
jgi:NAD(P)-dependent dehydrogenase (short-subunit alcohol dehydrogenase family)